MVNIHRLNDPLNFRACTKTKIVKGFIQRYTVWKDTQGREFDKIDGVFHLRVPGGAVAAESNLSFRVPPERISNVAPFTATHIQHSDVDFDEVLFFCGFIFLTLVSFLFGVVTGVIQTRRKYTSKDIRNRTGTNTNVSVETGKTVETSHFHGT
jgi:hypothetical protein